MVHILWIEISLLDLAELRLHYKTAGNLCYHCREQWDRHCKSVIICNAQIFIQWENQVLLTSCEHIPLSNMWYPTFVPQHIYSKQIIRKQCFTQTYTFCSRGWALHLLQFVVQFWTTIPNWSSLQMSDNVITIAVCFTELINGARPKCTSTQRKSGCLS